MLRIASIIVLCILLYSDASDARLKHNEQWEEFEEFLEWKKARQLREYSTNKFLIRGFDDDGDVQRSDNQIVQDPPSAHQTALMARYVINQAGNIYICVCVCVCVRACVRARAHEFVLNSFVIFIL